MSKKHPIPPGEVQNGRRARPYSNNTSGYKGVSQRGRKWRAQITVDNINFFLGSFDTPEEAHERYNQAAIELNQDNNEHT